MIVSSAFGILFVGESPSDEQIIDFLMDTVQTDPELVEEVEAFEHAGHASSWSCHMVGKPSPLEYDYELDYFPKDHDVVQVYELFMPHYDTAYRFYLYLDASGILFYGMSDSD